MITPELLEFFNNYIQRFNPKQQSIAENLLFDKTYHILKVYTNNQYKLVLKNRFTNDVIDFDEYVKSKCNC